MSKNAHRNATATADLKPRLLLAYVILFTSLAMIPLGFLCPCGVALAFANSVPAVSAVFGIASLLLPFVGLGGLLLMAGDRSKYKRGLAVVEVAEAQRLRYTYEPKKVHYQFLSSFRLLADPDHEFASHLMVGKLQKLPVIALDYSHAYGHGGAAIVYRATMVAFKEGFDGVSGFILYPRGWLDKLSDLITGRPLNFSTSKRFNKAFGVVGDDPTAIQNLFTDDLIQLCLQEPNLMLEIKHGRLLAYCYETTLDTAMYNDFLDLVLRISDELHQQARP